MAALAGLCRGVMAMDNADDFLLFFGGNPDEFQGFTSAAVGTDQCRIVPTLPLNRSKIQKKIYKNGEKQVIIY